MTRFALITFVVLTALLKSGSILPADGKLAVHESLVVVTENARLKALKSSTLSFVLRMDFEEGVGAPPLLYKSSPHSCSINDGEGDNGSQVKSGDGKCWIAAFPSDEVDIREFGCKLNGLNDCSDAIIAAANYVRRNGGAVLIPSVGIARSSVPLVLGAVKVRGATLITPTTPQPLGPHIQCDSTVLACLTFGVPGATSSGGSAENLIVSFADLPQQRAKAIIFQGNNSVCNNLMIVGTFDGFYFRQGISAHCNNLYSWNVTNCHLVVDGFAELYVNQARWGLNGSGDQKKSKCFIGITGRDPNSIFCNLCQFNLGSQSPSYLISYFDITKELNGILQISNSVVDMSVGACEALIHTDRTSFVYRLQIANSAINAPNCPLLDRRLEAQPPVDLQFTNNVLFAVAPSR